MCCILMTVKIYLSEWSIHGFSLKKEIAIVGSNSTGMVFYGCKGEESKADAIEWILVHVDHLSGFSCKWII